MDIAIKDGKIRAVDERVKASSEEELDADGRLTSPGFVDAHMHLDKAFIGGDAKWASRSVLDAVELCQREKKGFTFEDVKRRARKCAEMALLNGTTALRTHVDVDPTVGLTSLKAVLELKKECSNWIDIQPVAFVLAPFSASGVGESLLRDALRVGAEVLGCVPNDQDPRKHVGKKFDVFFKAAKEYDADIDVHVE